MKRFLLLTVLSLYIIFSSSDAQAGNPDRQGESGAYELLINPWARSAGLGTIGSSSVRGVDGMHFNVAGMSRVGNTEISLGHTIYLQGTTVSVNSLGLTQPIGKSGTIGVSLMALNFGDILVTTTSQPEGTGATFSPNFFNLAVGYSHIFANKISVGLLARMVNESTSDVSASGVAFDAGVQYVSGEKDNFHLGISLRNIGSQLSFGGEGLAFQGQNAGVAYPLSYEQRSAGFELPSMLNIGLAYDFYPANKIKLSTLGNFTSNAFSKDQLGLGLELEYNKMFTLRAGYNKEIGKTANNNTLGNSVYTGLSGGLSVDIPLSRENKRSFAVDYAYQATRVFGGTHNIGIRFGF
ncbi:MAG: PorV/PorQ family protein [Saprospiraceae bacterium]|nr:PorV/PorQ family protein [Saprospiraceae bacterium]